MGFYIKPKRTKTKQTEEQKVAEAARREANALTARTCQCCGRRFQANTGTIAHHGYERPGDGFQTSSCIGAKHLPFEVSRTKLGEHIENQKHHLAMLVRSRSAVQNETDAIRKTTTKRGAAFGKTKEYISLDITRLNFEEHQTQLRKDFAFYGSFDDMKKIELDRRATQIKKQKEYILMQTARWNGWQQTERWDAATKFWTAH